MRIEWKGLLMSTAVRPFVCGSMSVRPANIVHHLQRDCEPWIALDLWTSPADRREPGASSTLSRLSPTSSTEPTTGQEKPDNPCATKPDRSILSPTTLVLSNER